MNKTLLILIVALIGFLMPIGLVIYWRKKTDCNFLAFIVGALCFSIFVNVVESLMHQYFLSFNTFTANYIYGNPIVYAFYGAIMAGLFEESGRFFGYKILLGKYKSKEISVGYGIGHGGIECIFTLGLTYVLYAVLLITGKLGDPVSDTQLLQVINSIDVSIASIAVFERIVAIIIHISLSILMFKACSNSKHMYLYPISIILHILVDLPAGLYQAGILTNVFVVEGIISVLALIIFIISIRVYKKMDI